MSLRPLVPWALVALIGSVSGCALSFGRSHAAADNGSAPEPPPDTLSAPDTVSTTSSNGTVSDGEADTVVVENPLLQVRLERLELNLLEREAEIDELRRKLTTTQEELVRVLARLQQTASRAEAASVLAEAEVGVRSLGARAPEAAEAKRLLDLAKQEFDRQNYGGAAYLGTQARNVARAASSRRSSPEAGAAGGDQVFFLVPLGFKTLARVNAQEAPGSASKTLFTLETGERVRGYSYAQRWVYVRDDGGRGGWVPYSALGRQ